MGFNFASTQKHMFGGKKITRKVFIKNGKGYKSTCTHKNGKKCYSKKKHLSKSEIQIIKMGKFIPGLFRDISVSTPKKSRKNKN